MLRILLLARLFFPQRKKVVRQNIVLLSPSFLQFSKENQSITFPRSISAKEKQSLFDHDKCLSKLQIGSSEKIYQNPTQITQSRFKLPPTPLTAPESMRQFGTSASFSKQQNARSVGGNIQVEVGLKSMFN